MKAIYTAIDSLSETIGRVVAWLALAMVVLQFGLVVARYLFGLSFIMLDELLIYFHGCLFLFAAAYTLKHNGHVRVDLFFRDADARSQAWVNLAGTLFFLLPLAALTWWAGFPFVETSWQSLEGSTETSGLPYLYVYKTSILVFAALLAVQGVSEALKALMVLSGKDIPVEDDSVVL